MAEAVEAYKGRQADLIVSQALILYEQGKEIDEAAIELDVPARTIYRWLATNAQDRWHEAQKGRAVSDYDQSKKRRDIARDTLETLKQALKDEGVNEPAERNWRLAHAREVLRAADTDLAHHQWLLERLLKRIYGNETTPDLGGRVSITLNIGAQSRGETTVEGEVVTHNESHQNNALVK